MIADADILRRLRPVVAVLAWLALCLWAPVRADDGVLVLGRISDDPKRHHAQLKPLLDYVVPRMAEVGIREGRILMASDVQQMDSYLRRGRVDWVTETAATGMLLAARTRAELLLVTERDGRSSYHSVIFVRGDGGIADLGALKGHTIAFQNRASASAYFVPAAMLLESGLALEMMLSPMDRPSPDAVGFVFGRTENNIIAWVDKGLVTAGAFSDIDLARLRERSGGGTQWSELARSQPFPRGVEMVRSRLPSAVRQRLRTVLMQATGDVAGREALARFFGASGFHAADAEELATLERLRARAVRVKAALE